VSGQTAMTDAEIYVAMQNSDNTKRAYRSDISHWEQYKEKHANLSSVTNAIGFKDALTRIYAPSTASRIFGTVSAYHEWLFKLNKIGFNPFMGIKGPTRPIDEAPPVPADDEIQQLLWACDNGTSYGTRARVIVSLLLNGLRAQEVCDAKISQLKHDRSTGSWILNVLGKGNKWRAVPLNSETQQAIHEFWENRVVKGDWRVPMLENNAFMDQKMTTNAVRATVKFFCVKAKLNGITPHSLRHHYATRLVRAGVDLFTLQKLLGHARADTTQRYVGLDYTDLNKAMELDPMHKSDENHEVLFDSTKMEVENAPVPF
jgi:site-specific recombinase XerD